MSSSHPPRDLTILGKGSLKEEQLMELKLTIESSQAKEELCDMSPLFSINEILQRRRDLDLSSAAEIGAWTESTNPFMYHTARTPTNVHKKRKLSCQQKFSSLNKRSNTSCLTESDTNTPKSLIPHPKREYTLSKICPSTKQLSPEPPHPKLQKLNVRQNLKRPFKSNLILFKGGKRNYPYFKQRVRTREEEQSRTEERPFVDNLFKEDKINRHTLLGFIQNINTLRSREKSKANLDRTSG